MTDFQSQHETEHTPTPWATDPDDRPGMEWNVHIVERDRPHMRIAFTSNGPDSEANAVFIVEAVNNHARLTERCEQYKAQVKAGSEEIERLREFVAWVDSWVSNPAAAYSTAALDGMFRITCDKIDALKPSGGS